MSNKNFEYEWFGFSENTKRAIVTQAGKQSDVRLSPRDALRIPTGEEDFLFYTNVFHDAAVELWDDSLSPKISSIRDFAPGNALRLLEGIPLTLGGAKNIDHNGTHLQVIIFGPMPEYIFPPFYKMTRDQVITNANTILQSAEYPKIPPVPRTRRLL